VVRHGWRGGLFKNWDLFGGGLGIVGLLEEILVLLVKKARCKRLKNKGLRRQCPPLLSSSETYFRIFR
jgi:hypothetical protein